MAAGKTPEKLEQLPAELMRAHRKRFGPAAASPQLGAAAARSPSPGAQWSPQHWLKREGGVGFCLCTFCSTSCMFSCSITHCLRMLQYICDSVCMWHWQWHARAAARGAPGVRPRGPRGGASGRVGSMPWSMVLVKYLISQQT